MPSSLELAIRQRLAEVLAGETPLQAFDAWLVPATWDVNRDRDPVAFDLINEINLRLAEYTRGHLTESELRDQLRPLILVPASVR